MHYLTPTLSFFTTLASAGIVLPHPPGQYGVATSRALLIDHSREDTYAAEAGLTEDRKLMVSSFYPSGLYKDCIKYTSPYMPPVTAAFYGNEYSFAGVPNNTFASLEMEFCRQPTVKIIAKQSFPIVLFSPGLGNSRLIYSAMAQSLASEGFVVVTIDHPYDADIVEFPGGTTILAANITTDEQIEHAINVRVQDTSFVLTQLKANGAVAKLFRGLSDGSEPAMMFGHSLGGATAVAAALNDSRLAAAVNLDGTMFGDVLSMGSSTPLLLVAHDGKNLTTDPSWASTWNATKYTTKVAVAISNTTHGSFTDFPLIVDAVNGIPQSLRNQLPPLIGALSGSSGQRIVSALVG